MLCDDNHQAFAFMCGPHDGEGDGVEPVGRAGIGRTRPGDGRRYYGRCIFMRSTPSDITGR